MYEPNLKIARESCKTRKSSSSPKGIGKCNCDSVSYLV